MKRLPTVMLTSSADKSDINRAFEYGANAYLTKPGACATSPDMLDDFKTFWLKRVEFPDV